MAKSGCNIYRHIDAVLFHVFYVCYAGYFIKQRCEYFKIHGFWLHMERLKIMIQIIGSIPKYNVLLISSQMQLLFVIVVPKYVL